MSWHLAGAERADGQGRLATFLGSIPTMTASTYPTIHAAK